jgi:simple sugar transport system permease protein
MQLFMGVAYAITKGSAIFGFPDDFLFLGNGALFKLPLPLVIFLIAAFSSYILLQRTIFGAHLYLIGSNEKAARYAGIKVKAHIFKTYLLTSILSSVAGLVMMARTNSAKADYGSSYLLQAVLVVILGGVNPKGGMGTVGGIIFAVLSLQFLSSGFNMLRFNNFAKEFTWGALLLLVMMLNSMMKNANIGKNIIMQSRKIAKMR